MGDNGGMDVTPQERRQIEEALAELDTLDPADLPEAASKLADLLGRLLDVSGEQV